MNTHFVYLHKKLDGTVFYVGMGTIRTTGNRYNRAYSKYRRNPFWRFTVEKHGYEVEIVGEFPSRELASNKEMELISQYGRRDLGTGTLVNMTDGGDGTSNILNHPMRGKSHKISSRRKMSDSRKSFLEESGRRAGMEGKRHSDEARRKMSESKKGKSSWIKGKKLSVEARRKMSLAKMRCILDLSSGISYPSVSDAAVSIGINRRSIYKLMASGRFIYETTL